MRIVQIGERKTPIHSRGECITLKYHSRGECIQKRSHSRGECIEKKKL